MKVTWPAGGCQGRVEGMRGYLSAEAAASGWARTQLLLHSPLGQQAWAAHNARLAGLRRTYGATLAFVGIVTGTVSTAELIGGGRPLDLLRAVTTAGLLAGVGFVAVGWRELLARTVAPFAQCPRHFWPRRAWIVAALAILIASRVWGAGPVWSAVGGAAVAAPCLAAAVLEISRRPGEWAATPAG